MHDFATEITLLALCLYHELVIIHSIPDFPYIYTSVKTSLNPISAGGGGSGIHPPPGFSLAIATKINRSTPNFLTFNFYYRDII